MDTLKQVISACVQGVKYSLVLPLAASLALNGCSECYTHNDTTIRLNRPVDGRVASMQALEQEPDPGVERPRGELVDLINETHAVSSGGMPYKAYATRVPAPCLDGHPEWTTDTSFLWMLERGMYFPSLRWTMNDISTVNHGLGHLQHQGGDTEAIAELNEAEQMLMGYHLFMDESHSALEMARWAAYANVFGIEAAIRRVMQQIEEGQMDRRDEAGKYRRMDALVYSLLLEHDGDFSAVRKRMERLVENGTADREARERIRQLSDWHAKVEEQGGHAAAEAALTAKKMSAMEMWRLFGEEAARSYWNANARLLDNGLVYEQRREGDVIPVYEGFRDGAACEIVGETEMERKRPCRSTSRICDLVDGEEVERIRMALCCMTMNAAGGRLAFGRVAIEAEAFRYSNPSGHVMLDGLGWRNALLAEIKMTIGLNEDAYCRAALPD